jgi:hypothetical protein
MNLQSKKARIPIAALGVAALCTGGLGLIPSAAYAAGSLTISPTTTSVTTLDFGSSAAAGSTSGYTLAQPLADATYAAHVTSTGLTNLSLSVDGYTAPTGVTTTTPYLYYAQKATGGTAGPTASATVGPWSRVTAPASGGTAVLATLSLTSGASPNDVFLTGAVPGTYTVHFVDGGVQAGTDDDSVSPTITLTVKDAGAITADTSDDFSPGLSVPSSVGIGAPVTGTVAFTGLTLADARGSSAGAGVLGSKVNSLIGIAYTGVTGLTGAETTSSAGTYATTSTTKSVPVGRTTAAGTLTTTVAFDRNGDGTLTDSTLATATTSVSTNGVTSLTLAAHDVTGTIASTGSAVAVKTGQAAVTYEATVANSGTATDISGKVVYFTINGTAVNLAKLSTDGTAVDISSTTSKIYSATTDSSGVASLKVTSTGSATADSYSVDADSNGQDNGTDLTATYAAARASTVKITSNSADHTVAPGANAVIKGAVFDQFGSAVTPSSSASQQALLFAGTAASSCANPTVSGVAANTATQNATIAGGTFTFSYAPATTPTAGQCIKFALAYDASGDGTVQASEASAFDQVNFTSATAPATLTVTAPVEAATETLATHGAVPAGVPFTGTVYDSSNTPVAYKPVTLQGGDGTYFSTVSAPTTTSSTDDLAEGTITVVTNGSGVFTGYVFFGDDGAHKLTATSGTATASVNVTVSSSIDPYRVIVDDVNGAPGDTLIVTGKVLDMFDNPVPGNRVDLGTGASTVGTLAATTVTTNSQGIFSTTFLTGSNQSGDVTLTATLHNRAGTLLTSSATLVPDVTWKANAGLTFDNGDYQDEGKIAVANIDLVLVAPAKVTAGGAGATVKLSGSFKANTSVDIYARETGGVGYQLVDTAMSDDQGDYGLNVKAWKTSSYLARAAGVSSTAHTTRVYARVTLTAKALGGGKVRLSGNGDPNVEGTLRFYRSVRGTDIKLATLGVANGTGAVTVRLPRGARVLYATFNSGGISQGQSRTVRVTVK